MRPALSRPFGGFICSSLDLFSALRLANIPISPESCRNGVSEVYPGHIWMLLCAGRKRLLRKSTREGRSARKALLEACGVRGLSELPTHDENDAGVSALMAAAADGKVEGMTVTHIGDPLTVEDGTLREGPMVIPRLSADLSGSLRSALQDVPAALPVDEPFPSNLDAEALLKWFVSQALEGDPHVCTYAWAYSYIFNGGRPVRYLPSYTAQVIDAARRTRHRDLEGLGPVRLDTFIVAKSTRVPGEGHWLTADYEKEDWKRVLGGAAISSSPSLNPA